MRCLWQSFYCSLCLVVLLFGDVKALSTQHTVIGHRGPHRVGDTTIYKFLSSLQASRGFRQNKVYAPPGLYASSDQDSNASGPTISRLQLLKTYVQLTRPLTLIQAVGALIVGRLVVLHGAMSIRTEIAAIIAVYLSYGAGMVSNDCADQALDASTSGPKQDRPIASGQISVQKGWIFSMILSVSSLAVGWWGVNTQFALWVLSNLILTTTYALGLQKIFLVKNLIVGWLCMSPLIGATLVSTTMSISTTTPDLLPKLWRMAATGLTIGVAREILKDAQDVDIDVGHKATVPLVLGVRTARTIAMSLVLGTSAVLMTPSYRRMFASRYFFCGWGVATALSLDAACRVDLDKQQTLVKKSIYVMLMGLIMGLRAQT